MCECMCMCCIHVAQCEWACICVNVCTGDVLLHASPPVYLCTCVSTFVFTPCVSTPVCTLYTHIWVCMHVWVYKWVHTKPCVCCVYAHVCFWVCMSTSGCVWVCLCECVNACACIYDCVWSCIVCLWVRALHMPVCAPMHLCVRLKSQVTGAAAARGGGRE